MLISLLVPLYSLSMIITTKPNKAITNATILIIRPAIIILTSSIQVSQHIFATINLGLRFFFRFTEKLVPVTACCVGVNLTVHSDGEVLMKRGGHRISLSTRTPRSVGPRNV